MGGIAGLGLGTLGTVLGGPAGTALGIGSTVGSAVGGGLGSAAGSAITRRGSPLTAGLMGAAGGLAAPLIKDLLPERLKDILGIVPEVPGAPAGLAEATGTAATEKALYGSNFGEGLPETGLKEATELPPTPLSSRTSAGAAISTLPAPSAASSRLALVDRLRRAFA